jgi:glucosamine--fructose-6-phosphate aminotransferase (isomerizing)
MLQLHAMKNDKAPAQFMRVEIFEQPQTLARLLQDAQPTIEKVAHAARHSSFAVLAARGSSDNASTYGKYLLEGIARLPTVSAAPSLFTLYRTPPKMTNALVVGVSQSGYAADVIAVLGEARKQNAVTLAITNTNESPITNAADHVVMLNAGEEKALAATKTVTGQCLAYAMLAAELAGNETLRHPLRDLPNIVSRVLSESEKSLEQNVSKWKQVDHCVVVGRGYTYGAAEEIALKLKETAFVSAESFSAADFLHGPLALVEQGYPALVLVNHDETMKMTIEFIDKLLERNANVLAFATHRAAESMRSLAGHDTLSVADIGDAPSLLANIVFIVYGQLFAMHLATMRGHDPDVSRGVSKVTVTR